VIGRFLADALGWREMQLTPAEQRPPREGLTAYLHCAVRLAEHGRLERYLDDGHPRGRHLRLCTDTAVVFRARRRDATIHPTLHDGIRAYARPQSLGGHHEHAVIGPMVQASEPLAPYNRAPRYWTTCKACGRRFGGETRNPRPPTRELCDECHEGRERARTSRSKGASPTVKASKRADG
jgi:hypothetical protein